MSICPGQTETVEIEGSTVQAFVPAAPPPELTGPVPNFLSTRLARADSAFGQLNLATRLWGNWAGDALLRKEAVASSNIRAHNTTLLDLYSHEAGLLTKRKKPDSGAANFTSAYYYALRHFDRRN